MKSLKDLDCTPGDTCDVTASKNERDHDLTTQSSFSLWFSATLSSCLFLALRGSLAHLESHTLFAVSYSEATPSVPSTVPK